MPIDNNRAENAIRPFAVGRKNWLFSNTANRAKCSATLYSIVTTAQANGLDTEQLLTELFANLRKPSHCFLIHNTHSGSPKKIGESVLLLLDAGRLYVTFV